MKQDLNKRRTLILWNKIVSSFISKDHVWTRTFFKKIYKYGLIKNTKKLQQHMKLFLRHYPKNTTVSHQPIRHRGLQRGYMQFVCRNWLVTRNVSKAMTQSPGSNYWSLDIESFLVRNSVLSYDTIYGIILDEQITYIMMFDFIVTSR